MWIPRHKKAANKKAAEVAQFYRAHINFHQFRPTVKRVALHFEKSHTWALNYIRIARENGLLREDE